MSDIHFYPKEEAFPDDILCPLCINYEKCSEDGMTCKSVEIMYDDMEHQP
jgi:hypothetical protein